MPTKRRLIEENARLREGLSWAVARVYSEFPHPSERARLKELEKLARGEA